jgi:hypothetical protein
MALGSVGTVRVISALALDEHFFDLGDGLGGVEIFGAHVGAVHDRMAAVEAEGILELVEALAGGLVAAVDNPTIGGQQGGGAEEAIAVPPIARAGGGAASAQDTRRRAVDLLLFFL